MCILYTFGCPELGHLNFKPLSGSKIFTISQHKIVFAILLNGNGILNTSITQNSITFCYPLEINVHAGHTIPSLQRYVVKYDTPNDSVLNNLITTMYMIIGISHLIYPLLDNLAATDYSIVGMTTI